MENRGCRTKRLICIAVVCASATGCVKRMAVNSVANTLAGGGTGAYLTDDDPVLVGQALPFLAIFGVWVLVVTYVPWISVGFMELLLHP